MPRVSDEYRHPCKEFRPQLFRGQKCRVCFFSKDLHDIIAEVKQEKEKISGDDASFESLDQGESNLESSGNTFYLEQSDTTENNEEEDDEDEIEESTTVSFAPHAVIDGESGESEEESDEIIIDDKEPEIIERSPDRPRLKGKLRDSITLYSEKENESTAIEDKLIPDGNINDIFPTPNSESKSISIKSDHTNSKPSNTTKQIEKESAFPQKIVPKKKDKKKKRKKAGRTSRDLQTFRVFSAEPTTATEAKINDALSSWLGDNKVPPSEPSLSAGKKVRRTLFKSKNKPQTIDLKLRSRLKEIDPPPKKSMSLPKVLTEDLRTSSDSLVDDETVALLRISVFGFIFDNIKNVPEALLDDGIGLRFEINHTPLENNEIIPVSENSTAPSQWIVPISSEQLYSGNSCYLDVHIQDYISNIIIGSIRIPVDTISFVHPSMTYGSIKSFPWMPHWKLDGKVRLGLKLVKVKNSFSTDDKWDENTNGGNMNCHTWPISPQYTFFLKKETFCTFTLHSSIGKDHEIGFYVLLVNRNLVESEERLNYSNLDMIKRTTHKFSISQRVSLELKLAIGHYIIIPCPKNPLISGSYEFSITYNNLKRISVYKLNDYNHFEKENADLELENETNQLGDKDDDFMDGFGDIGGELKLGVVTSEDDELDWDVDIEEENENAKLSKNNNDDDPFDDDFDFSEKDESKSNSLIFSKASTGGDDFDDDFGDDFDDDFNLSKSKISDENKKKDELDNLDDDDGFGDDFDDGFDNNDDGPLVLSTSLSKKEDKEEIIDDDGFGNDFNIDSKNNLSKTNEKEENIISIFTLIREGSISEIEAIIRKTPLKLKYTNESGDTPLLAAIGENNTDLVCTLLKYNANVKEPNYLTNTLPIHVATKLRNCELLKLLMDYHAETKVKDRSGNSPASIAIQLGDVQLLKQIAKSDNFYPITVQEQLNIDISTFILTERKDKFKSCISTSELIEILEITFPFLDSIGVFQVSLYDGKVFSANFAFTSTLEEKSMPWNVILSGLIDIVSRMVFNGEIPSIFLQISNLKGLNVFPISKNNFDSWMNNSKSEAPHVCHILEFNGSHHVLFDYINYLDITRADCRSNSTKVINQVYLVNGIFSHWAKKSTKLLKGKKKENILLIIIVIYFFS